MKNLIAVALLTFSVATFGQQTQAAKKDRLEKFTPEQRNALHLKKMTSELNLNSEQQIEISKFLAEKSVRMEAMKKQRKAQKESGKQLSADERYKLKTAMLDEQIATKARLREVLSPEQYAKWEQNMEKKHGKKNREVRQRKSVKTKDIAK